MGILTGYRYGPMTQGCERLREWLARTHLNQRQAADLLKVHWTVLNKIVLGKRLPGLVIALRLEELTGIPVRAWTATAVSKQKPRRTRTAA